MALNQQVQQFPVLFCYWVVKNFQVVDTGQEQEQLVITAPEVKDLNCQNCVFIRLKFSCRSAASRKVEMPLHSMEVSWSSGEISESDWQWNDVTQWESSWVSSLLDIPTYWGSDTFWQRFNTNAAVLPNSWSWTIAGRLDSMTPKSELLQSIVCSMFCISNSILKL